MALVREAWASGAGAWASSSVLHSSSPLVRRLPQAARWQVLPRVSGAEGSRVSQPTASATVALTRAQLPK
eukprot:10824252-Alexandrium_andersonii.AAC.1